MHHGLVQIGIAVTLLLSSCTSMQERIDELNQPIPRHLDSATETTGLDIVDVDLRHKGSLSFGIESSVAVLDGVVRQAGPREATRQGTIIHLLVFQLPPGRYELVSVRGNYRSGNFYHTVEPFLAAEAGLIEVSAGQIAYVGKLLATAHGKIGQLGFTYSYKWDRDPSREAAALEVVERQYTQSSCIPIVKNRLASVL